jgi:predicted ribosome quality control (RQC) complex YloA/Tae2 family protein
VSTDARFPDESEIRFLFERQKMLASRSLDKKLRKMQKRVEERLTTLNACKNWPQVYHEGLLLQANLFRITKGMKDVVVSDWEQDGAERTLSLNPLTPPKDQVAAYFKRSKKLRDGEIHAVRLLKAAEDELTSCLEQKRILDETDDRVALESYNKIYGLSRQHIIKAAFPKKEKPKPYHAFRSQTGIEIRVGKSAKDNDLLTFHCSNGLDWWLHARNCPGSHVVVPFKKGQELDEETLHDAAELALHYSKAKEKGDGEVCLTQVKGLARVKGVPGKVMLAKHKVLRVVPDNQRWLRLKNSKIVV